jgi:hypothetical protein
MDNEKFGVIELMQTNDGVIEQRSTGNSDSIGPYVVATISERKN